MKGVIKDFWKIDGNTRNLISRVNHVLSMQVNLSLAIPFCPSLRSEPNLMVLVKGLLTFTWFIQSDPTVLLEVHPGSEKYKTDTLADWRNKLNSFDIVDTKILY